MSSAKVTIAIPTLNRCEFLRQSLGSALRQTHLNLEVIVADNCSEDGTQEFLATITDPRVVKVRHSCRLLMLENWDSCLIRATGEYFLLLSDDDYLEETAVTSLLSGFALGMSNPHSTTVGMTYGITRIVNERNSLLQTTRSAPALEAAGEVGIHYFRRHRDIYACSCLLRTSDLRSIGAYSSFDTVLAADAYAWSQTVINRGHVAFIPTVVSAYRVHLKSETALSKIDSWVQDMDQLVQLWTDEMCARYSKEFARSMHRAGQQYIAWMISMLINKSAGFKGSRKYALRTYYYWRSRFTGARQRYILLQGILRFAVLAMLPMIRTLWKSAMDSKGIESER